MLANTIPAQNRIPYLERCFEISLYLLVLSGFVDVAGTGELDLLSVVLVGGALILRGYLLVTDKKWIIPERWTTILTVLYAGFYLVDYLLLSGSFLTATVHLVLFVMVVRLFSAARDRDYYFLAILAFAMVLAAAMLTVNSSFLAAFIVFLVLAVVNVVFMEMRHASKKASRLPREGSESQTYRRMAFALFTYTPVLVFFILTAGALIFFVLPRVSAGYMGSYVPRNEVSTGFADQVELGQIGAIQQSNSVVMHIRIFGDDTGAHDLRWRGVALNIFDGKEWSKSFRQFPASRLVGHRFQLTRSTEFGLKSTSFSQQIHYRVLMEPIGTNVLFLAPVPDSVQGDFRLVTTDSTGAAFDADPEHPPAVYEGWSDLPHLDLPQLRSTGGSYPAEIIDDYLQLPQLDSRIPALAKEIARGKENNYDKAAAIEQYLRTKFGYTLQLPNPVPKDPIADFLFRRKRGHCEYFATAMAIMLRTLGIPTRVITGFHGGEFNTITSQYVIRARDAHAWVEVYFPEKGWVTFDPTPGGNGAGEGGWDRISLYMDALSSFWREWVVNFDVSHQSTIGQLAAHRTRSSLYGLYSWGKHTYRAWIRGARNVSKSVSTTPLRWTALALGILLLLTLPVYASRMWRTIARNRIAAHPEDSPAQAASIWYYRMMRVLARHGIRKSPVQTPSEFAQSITDIQTREIVSRFTQCYEGARFGGSREDAQQLPERFEEVSSSVQK